MNPIRVALPTFLLSLAALAHAADRPNIVFILADDLGYTDVSTYGSKYYETPNIDRLAQEGVKFTNGYTNGPNCQPTRAALISGQYGPRTGIYTVGNIDRFDWKSQALRPADNVVTLPADKITIAQSLKNAGYATGLFGKWHLGGQPAAHPSKRGFDEAIVSNGKHFNFVTDPKVSYPEGTYLADFLTDKAVDFIERHKDGPFFLYVPHFGVHSPYEAKKELIEKFKAKPAVGGHKDPVYAAMLASVDESVGRITAKLDELGLAENTLVIFSSDNGGVGGYQREGIQAKDTTDNAPLKAGKGSLHEGGIRVPYVFRWKGTIPAGTVSKQPIASIDLYPSTLELAKAQKPEGYTLDGVSYAALLKDPEHGKVERDAIFWHFPGYLGAGNNTWRTKPASAVRSGPWKLIQSLEDRSVQLYDLDADIGEKNNLAESQPEKAKELLAKLDAWRESIKAPLPTKNEAQANGAPKGGKKKRKRNQ
ncbi:sulfatase [Luteolibacter luteus]|uniref:Sulfatase n=1 Tax=Luteolibacter luteus TaxID=2728835 RepID=A0A858RCC7_9BACT|nr:sulfatase [Luteolibacter luteus]QJE94447.1 sulfatase [Luteolibacter luteus]